MIYKSSKKRIISLIFCNSGIVFIWLITSRLPSEKAVQTFRTKIHPSLAVCASYRSNNASKAEILCRDCSLALKESDGWFCEYEKDWQRRKIIYHKQDRENQISDERQFFFLHNWHPTFHCGFKQRIGLGDGGKWVCDLHKLQWSKSTMPLIYSFGSNGDFRFEKAIKQELPNSEIHTFDMKEFVCPINICTFHKAVLGDDHANQSQSLETIIRELDHSDRGIDILKVDIEAHEFNLFDRFFNGNKKNNSNIFGTKHLAYIRQILVEIHLQGNSTDESRRAHNFFQNFRRNDYVIFHKEANINECQNVFEYSFLRLNTKFFSDHSHTMTH